MENKKVLIPHRGVVALDIITSLKGIGLETILLHSSEDNNTLPVKIADKSFKFYSSRLEDSYLDKEFIVEKALELKVDYIHPGYGFLSENPEFAHLCEENKIKLISPSSKIIELTADKLELRGIANHLQIPIIKPSPLIKNQNDIEPALKDVTYPILLKPLKGYAGKGIKIAENEKTARELITNSLKRIFYKRYGFFLEKYYPNAHFVEIPFFRDKKGNLLLLPEIESSIQRRFQKIFQESPSPNLSQDLRDSIYKNSEMMAKELDYIGLGYIEFMIYNDMAYFSEINPCFQINSLIPEIHLITNFIKKQFALSNHEILNNVKGTKIIKPEFNIALVSLMAENPYFNFRPSSGTITDFYNYSTIRNIFKTSIYTGARISPLYSPYIGKILSFSRERKTTLNNLHSFLKNIYIRGVHTNLIFLRKLLENDLLLSGKTTVDFLQTKFNFNLPPTDHEIRIATSLMAAAFHVDNKKRNFKEELRNMKQPSFFKKILGIS